MAKKIIVRLGNAAQVPVLEIAEPGYDVDKKVMRIGDGTSAPPRIMTDKSLGSFDFSSVTDVIFTKIVTPNFNTDTLPATIQNGTWNTVLDTSNTSNLVIANLVPPPTTPFLKGLRFSVVMANACTGPSTITLNGTTKTIKRRGVTGTPVALTGGEWAANEIVEFVYDGTDMVVSTFTQNDVINIYNNNFAITTSITKTVYGVGADFPNFAAAFAWVSEKTISSTGLVTFQLPAGIISISSDIFISHANGDRIRILGATLAGSLPSNGTLQLTGHSAGQQASDNAVNKALLNAAYSTKLSFTLGAKFVISGNFGLLQDIYFTSNGQLPAGLTYGDGVVCSGGKLTFNRIAISGFQYRGLNVDAVNINFENNFYSIGNGFFGVHATTNSILHADGNFVSMSNGGVVTGGGIKLLQGSNLNNYSIISGDINQVFIAGNKGDGWLLGDYSIGFFEQGGLTVQQNSLNGVSCDVSRFYAFNCSITGNGVDGLLSNNQSMCTVVTGTVTSTQFGMVAFNGGHIYRGVTATVTGGTAAYSPALTVSGNNGALIY